MGNVGEVGWGSRVSGAVGDMGAAGGPVWAGRLAGLGGPVGGQAYFLYFVLFFYIFFLFCLFNLSNCFSFNKIPKWHLNCCYKLCHNHKKFQPKII